MDCLKIVKCGDGMSEKRFRFEKECTENFFTEKGVFYYNERPMGANEIIALLNSLYDKNEQLRKEHKIAIDEMITDYKNLEKENEQLKNELRKEKSLREYSDSMYGADLIVNIRFSNDIGYWKSLPIEEYKDNMLISLLDMMLNLSDEDAFNDINYDVLDSVCKYEYVECYVHYDGDTYSLSDFEELVAKE